uniref:Myb-like domain-containing protein n=1 Tax=Tetraselmis sp. GSL018 TaxID=582737 RepID=A0A061R407_9CHLO
MKPKPAPQATPKGRGRPPPPADEVIPETPMAEELPEARRQYVKNVVRRVQERGRGGDAVEGPPAHAHGAAAMGRPRRAAASAAEYNIQSQLKHGMLKPANDTLAACEEALRELKRSARAKLTRGAKSKSLKPGTKGEKARPAGSAAGKHRRAAAGKPLTAREMGLAARAPKMKRQGKPRAVGAAPAKPQPLPQPPTESSPPVPGEADAVSSHQKPERGSAACGTSDQDRNGEEWTTEEVAALNKAWFSTDPLHANFWAAVAAKVSGRSASECFNKFMDRHGASPVFRARKPRRYNAPIEASAAIVAGSRQRSSRAQTRKIVRHMRWKQRAEELNMDAEDPEARPEDEDEDGESQRFFEAMGRQERTDAYIEALLRRQRKAKTRACVPRVEPSSKVALEPGEEDADRQQISRLEEDIRKALEGGFSEDDTEQEEEDFYFSEDDDMAANASCKC